MTQEIQEYSATEAALAELREKYLDIAFDLSTPAGLKEAKAARTHIRGYRTHLETTRKKVKAPVLQQCKDIDAAAERITVELQSLEIPIDQQIKKREAEIEEEKQRQIEAEAKRIENILDRIKELRGAVAAVNSMGAPTPEKGQEFIDDVKAMDIDGFFEEFHNQATTAKAETLLTLADIHLAAVERKAEDERIANERAELEELRAAQEKREKQEREDREAEEAVAAAELKKQQDDLDRQKKEQDEKQEALDLQEERLAEENRQAEKKKREEKEARERAEQKEKDRKKVAADAAKRAEYPGDQAIVDALAAHFDVPSEVATAWLVQLRKAA